MAGIQDAGTRKQILHSIHGLLDKYGDRLPCAACKMPHSADCQHSAESEKKCMGCSTNEVNTVCVPCGHAVHCRECLNKHVSKYSVCPHCRTKLSSVIPLRWAAF